jgi:glycosyltransferase involved in cell wall biosynthesis
MSGRENTMSFIYNSLKQGGHVDLVRCESLLEKRTIGRILTAIISGIWSLLRHVRPVPLQGLLFHDRKLAARLANKVEELQPSTVYFDGIRSGLEAPALRARFPNLRLVCDFDDLMSRRVQMLRSGREQLSLGYLKNRIPAWLERVLLRGWIGKSVLAYEQHALKVAELRVIAACDAIVLVSDRDAVELRKLPHRASIEVIPPVMPVASQAPSWPQDAFAIRRFVFVGSDSLVQNRQAIEFLVSLWNRVHPRTPLHVFGRQSGTYEKTPGLHFHGFVEDIAVAYEPGSVLLAPSFLSGGVKTKVLEAMAYGVIPVGTALTFEGIRAPVSPLVCETDDWASLVSNPSEWEHTLATYGPIAIAHAMRNHSPDTLGPRWRQVIWPEESGETPYHPEDAAFEPPVGAHNIFTQSDSLA